MKIGDYLNLVQADFVGGDAVAVINGKHTVVARNTAEGIVLTEDGTMHIASLTAADVEATPKQRRSKKNVGQVPDLNKVDDDQQELFPDGADAELTDPNAAPAEAPVGDGLEHALEIHDDIETQEHFS